MSRLIYPIWILLIVFAPVVKGQTPASYGLKAGLMVANQSWKYTNLDYTLDTEPDGGLAAAFFVEAFKGEHFSFQLDLAYLEKGSTTTTESITINHLENNSLTVNEGDVKTSDFSYISIATLARYRFDQFHLVAEIQYQSDLSPVTNEEPLLINNDALSFTIGIRRIVSF